MEIYNKKGFTLIELLVSISIIATLSAILLPNFMGARERAKDAKAVQDMTAIKNALRLYYNDTKTYPAGNGIDIQGALGAYMTNTGIGYTYYQTLAGDGFELCASLNSAQGTSNTDSQTACGTANCVGPLWYVVCAK